MPNRSRTAETSPAIAHFATSPGSFFSGTAAAAGGEAPEPQAVLYPLQPRPGESLTGFVARSCSENVIERTCHVLRTTGYRHLRAGSLPTLGAPYSEGLATALAVPIAEITRRLYRALPADEAGPPMLDFFGVPVRAAFIGTGGRRIAPAALVGSGNDHHRAIWDIRPIGYCAESGTLLIDRCQNPACGAKLRWFEVRAIPLCESCGADQRDFPTTPVPEVDRDALKALADLLNPDPVVRDHARAGLPADLHSEDPGTLFELALTLSRFTLAPTRYAQPAAWKASEWPVERLAHASRMLSGWPRSLCDMVSSERLRVPNVCCTTPLMALMLRLTADVSLLPRVRELLVSEFGWLLDHRPNYANRIREIREHRDLVTAKEAARLLALKASQVRRLREAGVLNGETLSAKARVHAPFLRSDVIELRRALNQRVSPAEFFSMTGLRLPAVEQLLCLSVVKQYDHPAVSLLYPGIQLDRTSVDALVDRVRGLTKPLDSSETEQWLPLSRVMRVVGGQEKPWGPLLKFVMENNFAFRSPDCDETSRLADLYVEPSLLSGLGTYFAFEKAAHPTFTFASHLTDEECCELLNCESRELYRLIRRRTLQVTEGRDKRRIVRHSADNFSRTAISSLEVIARVGLQPRQVDPFLRERGISAGPCHRFWYRHQVEPAVARRQIDVGSWRRRVCRVSQVDALDGACDLTDDEWRAVEPLMNSYRPNKLRISDRGVVNAILWVHSTGATWDRLPRRYGKRETCYARFHNWRQRGDWANVMRMLLRYHKSVHGNVMQPA